MTDPDHWTAYRLPGTSVLWAGLYGVFGRRYSVVRIVHCLLGATTILLVYGIGKRCFRESIGLLSAATFAIWPTSVFYSNELASEPLFTFLLSWYILLTLQFAEAADHNVCDRCWRCIWVGHIDACQCCIYGPLELSLGLVAVSPSMENLGFEFANSIDGNDDIIPWVFAITKPHSFHKFLPFGTGGGDVLLGGNNRVVATDPVYYGYWVFPTVSLPEYREQLKAPNDELIRDSLEKKLAMRWLSDNPGSWWYLLEAKFRRSLTPVSDPHLPACTELVWAHRGDRIGTVRAGLYPHGAYTSP